MNRIFHFTATIGQDEVTGRWRYAFYRHDGSHDENAAYKILCHSPAEGFETEAEAVAEAKKIRDVVTKKLAEDGFGIADSHHITVPSSN
jgi:hypothetical protein